MLIAAAPQESGSSMGSPLADANFHPQQSGDETDRAVTDCVSVIQGTQSALSDDGNYVRLDCQYARMFIIAYGFVWVLHQPVGKRCPGLQRGGVPIGEIGRSSSAFARADSVHRSQVVGSRPNESIRAHGSRAGWSGSDVEVVLESIRWQAESLVAQAGKPGTWQWCTDGSDTIFNSSPIWDRYVEVGAMRRSEIISR